ncbi:hypothetical protein AAMO2058_000854300 [Amorphochlora amoebiformis]|eukprot:1008460-Amorphochlora_amoeboformis.AAC.2
MVLVALLCLVPAVYSAEVSALIAQVTKDYEASLLETSAKKYDPIAPPGNEFVFDNPAINTNEVPFIAGTPKCEVRPESVFEINRLRVSANNIKQAISAEVTNMAIRKEFVGKMTDYINDRIKELNEVKRQIQQEEKWLKASKAKIMYLHSTEKLIKTEDIMTCLKRIENQKKQADTPVTKAITDLTTQKEEIEKEVEEWEAKLKGGEEEAA